MRQNFRAAALRISRVQNVHRNVFPNGWRQRCRMEHLRSKVRQFGRLIETHLPDHAGIAAKLGIGRHYAIDVSPDFYARRLQRGADNGSCEV